MGHRRGGSLDSALPSPKLRAQVMNEGEQNARGRHFIMSMKAVHAHLSARLKVAKQKRRLVDLRNQSRDLLPPVNLKACLNPPAPTPAAPMPSPLEGASPFSLEALIFEEMNQAQTPERPIPLMVDLWAEGQAYAADEMAREHWVAMLSCRAPAYALWTDQIFSGLGPEAIREARQVLRNLRPDEEMGQTSAIHGPQPQNAVGILRAEPLLDPWQLFETHILGADGALVNPQWTSRGQMEDLMGQAEELGLFLIALVEGGAEAEQILSQGLGHLCPMDGDFYGPKAPKLKTWAQRRDYWGSGLSGAEALYTPHHWSGPEDFDRAREGELRAHWARGLPFHALKALQGADRPG